VRIAVAATPQVAIPTLDALLTSPHQLVGVITQPDRAAGRGKEFRQSEVGDWAESNEIPLLKP
jgi:methionyl-tRNA formyltransferase